MLAQDRSDRFHVFLRDDPAGRVLRRIQDQQFGLRGDLRFEFSGIETEQTRLAQIDRHRHRAHRLDLRFIDRETGNGIDDLVADTVIGRRDNCVRDEGLRTGTDDDVIRMNVDMPRAVQEIRRGFAQFQNAGGRRIAVLAVVDRLDARFADVLRCRESG